MPDETVPQPKVKTKPSIVNVVWNGEMRFDAGKPNGPTLRIDGSGATGPSPPETLLASLAACAGIDVVDILAKGRTPVHSLSIEMVGERVDSIPRRYKHITMKFKITGIGIERDQALRAIDLSVTKYCSVGQSLAKDIGVEWELELAG